MRNRTRWEMLATSTAWLLDFPSCKLLQALEFCFCFCNWLLITFFIFHFSRKQSRVKKGRKGRRETGGGRLWGNHNSSNVAGILPTVKYIYRDICIYMCIYIRFEAVENRAWFSFCSLTSTILLSCCEKVKHDFLIYFQTLSHFSLQNINFVCRCFRFFFCSSAPFLYIFVFYFLLFALSFVLCLLHCSRRCWFVQFDNHCGL